jgi:hypothetical protein
MDRESEDPVGQTLPGESDFQADERFPSYKLDLRFFTSADRCPAMVRQGSRKSFELFVYLAHRFLSELREPISPSHEELCDACGLDPRSPNARSTLSHLLDKLRRRYAVIEYERVRRRRPKIRLTDLLPGPEAPEPRHYVYLNETWGPALRRDLVRLGTRAFATQYMYVIAKYESDLAQLKHRRPYWFFPLERISATFHVSPRFAHTGLQALIKIGVLHVVPGQYGREAPNDEFGRANRYFFRGLGGITQRRYQLRELRAEFPDSFSYALRYASLLTNGRTAKNVRGLCELLSVHGRVRIGDAFRTLSEQPKRSLKWRLGFVRWLLNNS